MRLYLVHCGLVQHILARFMKGSFIFDMLTFLELVRYYVVSE